MISHLRHDLVEYFKSQLRLVQCVFIGWRGWSWGGGGVVKGCGLGLLSFGAKLTLFVLKAGEFPQKNTEQCRIYD